MREYTEAIMISMVVIVIVGACLAIPLVVSAIRGDSIEPITHAVLEDGSIARPVLAYDDKAEETVLIWVDADVIPGTDHWYEILYGPTDEQEIEVYK